MQKLSETVYRGLFWLISGLLVWLVILPITLICLPLMLVVRGAGLVLFKIPQSNIAQAERRSQASPESRPASPVESLVVSLLLTTLVEVPALVAAVISLQPTRFIKGEPEHARMLQPQQAKAHSNSSTDPTEVAVEVALEVAAKENRSER